MKHSFSLLIRQVTEYVLQTAAVCFSMLVFYSLMQMKMEGNAIQNTVIMMSSMMALAYCTQLGLTIFQQALSFGATRKGWILASQPAKILYALLAALCILLIMPLGGVLFKGAAGFNILGAVHCFLVCIVMCYVGQMMGYFANRYGNKKMMILFLPIVIIFVIVFTVSNIQMEGALWLVFSIGRWALVVQVLAALAVCVLCEAISWRLIRRAAVTGGC